MKIKNDYEGSSIVIDSIDQSSNTAYLKLDTENGKARHYYNFIVENDSSSPGFVYIQNLNESFYYSKNSFSPFVKKDNNWSKLDSKEYELFESQIMFKIKPNSCIELSLSPRYTIKDLINFCKVNNISYTNSTLLKIKLGNEEKPSVVIIGRQHPGETLSSFFIEGMIKEIINNSYLMNNFNYIFYPLVNVKGVQNGNHRYVDSIDFNRCWNISSPPAEIDYLKNELNGINNLKIFIDVHNDELTSKDYIRTSSSLSDEIAGIQVLKTMSSFKRFIRALIKQRKIINLREKTAREYVEKKYHCTSILIELSLNDEFDTLQKKGQKFISSLCSNEKFK